MLVFRKQSLILLLQLHSNWRISEFFKFNIINSRYCLHNTHWKCFTFSYTACVDKFYCLNNQLFCDSEKKGQCKYYNQVMQPHIGSIIIKQAVYCILNLMSVGMASVHTYTPIEIEKIVLANFWRCTLAILISSTVHAVMCQLKCGRHNTISLTLTTARGS